MSNGVSMYACTSFAPLVDSESKILILGSMPGVKSLTEQEYYAHPRNRFWQLLALLLGEDNPTDYVTKKAMLKNHHIALWDVLDSCDIEGASDASIRNPVPNDMNRILHAAPIQAIFCTGQKAGTLYKKYCLPQCGMPAQVLPSTSPANCAVKLEGLLERYTVIRQILEK